NHDCGGHGLGVGDGELGGGHSESVGALQGAATEFQQGLAGGVARDDDLAEGHASPSGAESFHCGFLGGEAARHVLGESARVAAAPEDFAGREDPVEEAVAPAVEGFRDAGDLGEVDPDEKAAHSPKNRAMRSESGSGCSACVAAWRLASNWSAACCLRLASVASRVWASGGCCRRTGASDGLVISPSAVSVGALTVAVRGSPVRRLISPNAAPSSRIVSSRVSPAAPRIETATRPLSMTNIEEPFSPSRTTISPGA